MHIHKAAVVEILGIHNGRVDVGEYLELTGTTHILAIARCAIGNHPAIVAFSHLTRLEGLDHPLLFHHAANPLV